MKKVFKKAAKWIKNALITLDDRQWWRRNEDSFVYKICGGLLLAAIFFLICMILVMLHAFFYDDWRLNITAEGVNNMQLFWQQHSALIKAFFYTITLFVACHNLIKYIDVETCRFLEDIHTKLNDKSQKMIHNSLLDPDSKKAFQKKVEQYLKDLPGDQKDIKISVVEFLDYLGALELSAILLQRGMLSKKEFVKQFGSRYEYIMRSPIINLIKEEKDDAYEPLKYAISVVEKHQKKASRKAETKSGVHTDIPDTSTQA